jgi:hypothetical protein
LLSDSQSVPIEFILKRKDPNMIAVVLPGDTLSYCGSIEASLMEGRKREKTEP